MKTPLSISDYLQPIRSGGIQAANTPFIKKTSTRKAAFEDIFKALKTEEKKAGEQGSEGAVTQRLTLKDYLLNTVRNPSLSSLHRIRHGNASDLSGDQASSAPETGKENTPSIQSEMKTNETDFTRAMKRLKGSGKAISPDLRQRIDSCVELASQKYDVPSDLIRAIIQAESGFRPHAVSSAGAQGLMQLMPGTAEDLGVENPFDIDQNIDGGVRYFKQMMDEFDGDVKLSLAAYNAGPGAVKRYDGVPPYRETLRYIRKVMKYSDDIA
jgi:hypothetical protein